MQAIPDKDYPHVQSKHPRLQLLTIQDLFDGKRIDMPPVANLTFKNAPKAKVKKRKGKQLPFGRDAEY